MRKILVSVSFVLAVFCLNAQLEQKSISTANGVIPFYQYKPPIYNSNSNLLPLIISLHGGGEAGPSDGSTLGNIILYGLPKVVSDAGAGALQFTWQGQTEGFIMLAPQCSAGQIGDWPLYFVDEMIEYGVANLRVDRNRVFLTGYSFGGKGVWKYATSSETNARKLAGIVPAAPAGVDGGTNFCNIAANKVATWAHHALNDGITGSGNTVSYTNASNNPGCPTSPGYPSTPVIPAVDTIIPTGAHDVYMYKTYDLTNKWHYPNVFQWMLKISRSLDPTTNQAPVPVITLPGSTLVSGTTVLNITAPLIKRNFPLLDGTASYDPDDIIMDYLWMQDGGPRQLLTTPASGFTDSARQWPTLKVLPPPDEFYPDVAVSPGTYQFRLRVKDYLTSRIYGSTNHTVFAPLTVNVVLPGSGHAAPAVDAGNDIVLGASETYKTKIGVAEDVYNGNGINGALYNWEFVSGPQTPQILNYDGGSVYTGNTQYVRFTNMDVPGVYVFRFTAGNGYGETASDLINIIRPGGAALPVSLLYLKAENAGTKNIISWATSQEVNSDRFDILRSTDGVNFTKIGTLASKGGSVTTNYQFDDNNAPIGSAYYRLSQVDKDGKTTLTKIVTVVNNTRAALVVEKYPNPVHDILTVTAAGTLNGTVQVMIADMQGKTILQQQWQKDQPLIKKTVNVASLQNGVYQVIVSAGPEKRVSSFVKY